MAVLGVATLTRSLGAPFLQPRSYTIPTLSSLYCGATTVVGSHFCLLLLQYSTRSPTWKPDVDIAEFTALPRLSLAIPAAESLPFPALCGALQPCVATLKPAERLTELLLAGFGTNQPGDIGRGGGGGGCCAGNACCVCCIDRGVGSVGVAALAASAIDVTKGACCKQPDGTPGYASGDD